MARYAPFISVQFGDLDQLVLETRRTYILFDQLYRNGPKTNSQFPPIQGLPRALAQVSAVEPNKVYPQ